MTKEEKGMTNEYAKQCSAKRPSSAWPLRKYKPQSDTTTPIKIMKLNKLIIPSGKDKELLELSFIVDRNTKWSKDFGK